MKPFFYERRKNQSGLQDLTVRLKIPVIRTRVLLRLEVLAVNLSKRKNDFLFEYANVTRFLEIMESNSV